MSMAIRDSVDLIKYGLIGNKYSVDVADNTSVTLCPIIAGKTCYGVVLVNSVLSNGAVIDQLAWDVSDGALVKVVPQITPDTATGSAEFIVLWKR